MDPLNHHHLLELPDGRRLCWADWGEPDAPAVLAFHGLPGSRLQCRPAPGTLEDVRVITVDRPGIGGSTFQPGRRLLDWPDDVARLADHLGLERFAVAGLSGGGPFAAATAWKLGGRVERLGLISPLAPLAVNNHMSRMEGVNQFLLWLAKEAPLLAWPGVGVAAWLIRDVGRPLFEMSLQALPECDQKILRRDFAGDNRVLDIQEAFRGNPNGVIHEAALASREWGFELAEVRTPTILWHGDADTIVPVELGRYYAETLPECRFHLMAGMGHFLFFAQTAAIYRAVAGLAEYEAPEARCAI